LPPGTPTTGHGPAGRTLLEQHPAASIGQSGGVPRSVSAFFAWKGLLLQSVKHNIYFPQQKGNAAFRSGVVMLRLIDLIKDKKGATAVEYGLILALIFLAMIAALQGVAGENIKMWNNVSEKVSGR
jgi:pilus assembly protein Flp/PilA